MTPRVNEKKTKIKERVKTKRNYLLDGTGYDDLSNRTFFLFLSTGTTFTEGSERNISCISSERDK
jgi:hypothetical protein